MSGAATHNRIVPQMVVRLVKEAGSPQDVLIALESLCAGVCTYIAASTSGGQTPQQVFDLIASAMPERLADLSAQVLKPEGHA